MECDILRFRLYFPTIFPTIFCPFKLKIVCKNYTIWLEILFEFGRRDFRTKFKSLFIY